MNLFKIWRLTFIINFDNRPNLIRKAEKIKWPTLEKMPNNKPLPFFNKRTSKIEWL